MRHRLDLQPRYALVTWPDAKPNQPPSCIFLFMLADAVKRGATVVAREFTWEHVTSPQGDGDDGA